METGYPFEDCSYKKPYIHHHKVKIAFIHMQVYLSHASVPEN